ncbi:MAG: dihydrolipoyl dehydrogenase [bacterium JZ-2024 1]
MMQELKAKAVVLGGGPGGYTAAIRLGQLGVDTILVEKEKVGGTCLNRGCIPTKALLSSTEFLEDARFWKKAGIVAEPVVNLSTLEEWKNDVVNRLVRGVETLLKGNGVRTLYGSGKILDAHHLLVEGDSPATITFENLILATGSEPTPLPGFPFDGEFLVSSDHLLRMESVPSTLLVVGAGAVGLELAQIYHRLGAQIIIVELLEQILPGIEAEVVQHLHRILTRGGMEIHTSSRLKDMSRKNGRLEALIETPSGEQRRIVDKILISVGRRPLSQNLGLEKLGLEISPRGFISVNEYRQTNIPHIYSIGDVSSPPLLAHKAIHEGMVAAGNIAGKKKVFDPVGIPGVIYTQPEVAVIGMTEQELQKKGVEYQKGIFPYTASGRAVTMGKSTGIAKILSEAGTGKILGIHLVGPFVSELISEGTLALQMGATVEDLTRVIHPHPTLSESLGEAAENLFGQAIHILNPRK